MSSRVDDQDEDPLIRRVARTRLYCRKCGYDLTDLTSGRCPECGNEIDEESFDSVSTHPPVGTSPKKLFLWFGSHPVVLLLAVIVPAAAFVVFQLIRKVFVHH